MKSPLVYRMAELTRVVGLSKTTIYHMIKQGDFPAPIQMTKRSVAWRVADVKSWVATRQVSGAPDESISTD